MREIQREMIKRIIFSILACILLAPTLAWGQGKTIDQLGAGSALTGTEKFPMFQGSNPAATTTPRALATYFPTVVNSIDATQSSGSDMCAKISAAAATLNSANSSGGIIDARGFTGVQACAASMFNPWPGGGFWSKVLLGSVNIRTAVTQTIPTRTWLKGVPPYNDDANAGQLGGTSIEAAVGFSASTPVVQLGASNPAFTVHLEHIMISCVNPSGTSITGGIGLKNIFSQEGTWVDHVGFRGCYTGLLLGLTYGDSNTYQNMTFSDHSSMTGTTMVCIQVGTTSDSDMLTNNATAEISKVSCGASTVTPTNFMLLDGFSYRLTDIYFDSNPGTNNILIGSQSAGGLHSRNITLQNIACGGGTNCIQLGSGVNGPITIISASGGGTNVIKDTLTGGCTIPHSTETSVGLYARGYNTQALPVTDSFACHGIQANMSIGSNCNGSSSAAFSGTNTNFAGLVNPGATNVTDCTVNFDTTTTSWPGNPRCAAQVIGSNTTAFTTSASTSAVVFHFGGNIAGQQFSFECSPS